VNIWQKDENWVTPLDGPSYPPPPSDYRDVMFQMVYFTTEQQNIAPLLPEPLLPSPKGLCCAFAIDVTFCADYGPFKEMGVVVGCVMDGEEGFFLTSLFLNSSDAIAPGREIYGSPKKFSTIHIRQEGNELTSTAIRADIPIIRINSRLSGPADPDEIPALWPMYILKVIPAADGKRPAVKQLLLAAELEDTKVNKLFKGPGVVSFSPTVAGEFWRLQPRTFEGAIYQVCSYRQGYSKVVKDYLA